MLRNICKIVNNSKLNIYSFSRFSSSCIVNKSFIIQSADLCGGETSIKFNHLKSAIALNKKGKFYLIFIKK